MSIHRNVNGVRTVSYYVLKSRASQISILFVNLWWAIELTLFDAHERVPALGFVDQPLGTEVAFDLALWLLVAATLAAIVWGTKKQILVSAFANLMFWVIVGVQFWQVTQTKLVSGLCFAIAIGAIVRIAEVSRPDA